MTDRTAAQTRPPTKFDPAGGVRPEWLRGRAAGVVVGAAFGAAWAASALSSLDATVAGPVAILAVGIFGALMTGARHLRRIAAALPEAAREAGRPNARRRSGLILSVEWIAIIAAVWMLSSSGHPQWIPAVICAAVGLHFIPLARLFDVPLYYATAAALCMLAATTMILGLTGAPATLWHLLPGLGAALTLWATSTGLLALGGTLALPTYRSAHASR